MNIVPLRIAAVGLPTVLLILLSEVRESPQDLANAISGGYFSVLLERFGMPLIQILVSGPRSECAQSACNRTATQWNRTVSKG